MRSRPGAVLLLVFLSNATVAHAQVFTDKVVGQKNQALADSLKQAEYPYALPIWGDKATARGYKLPYSAGIGMQYFGQKSDLVINNLNVGFNGGTLHNLDGIIRFDKAQAITHSLSLRPDVWLLPFLNVYGIFSRGRGSTEVGYGLWLPDSAGNERPVVSANTKIEFDATTFGFGLTPTLGVGGGWLALDMNVTWSDVPQLSEPAMAFVFDPRMGKFFTLRNPDENINFWVGGFRVKLNTGTTGSIPLGDALPIGEWQSKVDQAQLDVERRYQENEAWWNSLTPPQQANPVNRAKYEATKATLERTAGFLSDADQAVSNAANSTVEYALDKRPEDMWNFMVGTQYQMNRSWMARLEIGGLTSRTHVIAGIQYRFGL